MKSTTSTVCHVVAVPYPGRGHVNPMINLCKLLASKQPNIQITIVLTEERLSFIASDVKPHQLTFSPIPNVLPSELVRSQNYPQFYEAVVTKMEAPFQKLIDQVQPPMTAIISDTELLWAVPAARPRNIPVVFLWTASASYFASKCKKLKMGWLVEEGEHGSDRIGENGDLKDPRVMRLVMECIAMVPKVNYLLLSSVYELETEVIDSLLAEYTFPVYPIGPAIPYLELGTCDENFGYLKWLDFQPKDYVLYVSLGSNRIVEDWKIGCEMDKRDVRGDQCLITMENIVDVVQRFMDLESTDGKEMRKRAKELSSLCQGAISKYGSSDKNLADFIRNLNIAATI